VVANFIFPHAHSLCREMIVTAYPPDGSQTTLLAIRRFDESWHDTYRFAKPLHLARGTRLETKFTYDNTTANLRNPHHPPQRVVYGSNADDEMCDVYLQITPIDPNQLAVLEEHQDQFDLKSKIIGYSKSLELHPDDPWNVEALAAAYIADHRPQRAIELLKDRPALVEQSVQANVILGMAYLAAGERAAAERCLRQSLAKDDKSSLAWLGLGQALVANSQPPEAERALRRAIELAPRMTVARLDLVDLLLASGRLKEAAAQCDAASKFAPADYKPRLKHANLLAQQKQYDASLKEFAAARELAPFLYTPQSSLAIACYQSGDEATALRLLQESLAHDPHDPVPHCFLGQIARRANDLPSARELLNRAAELPTPPTWPASHRKQFLVLVYTEQLQLAQQLEDEKLARQTLAAWLELDPNNEALRSLQQQLDEGAPTNPGDTRR
jgi:tetratricopeptide (TPR) repeat protein